MTVPKRGRIALLYDCTYPHVPGGGQKRLFEIFHRLVAKGWEVDWFGLKSWDGDDEPRIGGIRFIAVAPFKPLYGADGKRLVAQTFHYGAAIAKFPELGKYDIVHMGQWPYFHFFPVWLFALFGRARISVDWWEVWGGNWRTYYGAKGLLGMVLEKVCARIPHRVVAISETGRRQLTALGIAPRKITVIHNGLDFSAIRLAAPAKQGSDLIYLGRLQPHKNVDLLIDALALLKERGLQPNLAVIGDGPERDALQSRATASGVADQIVWHGAIESDAEVHSILKASKVFVHPSTKEGGGSITSLEANAAGLRVIAFSAEGGISPELIIDNENGYWIATVNANALADGIAGALSNSDVVKQKRVAENFAENFDWAGLVEQYDQVFLEIQDHKT